MTPLKNTSIILFDGVCNLCNSSVQFVLKHDKNKNFLFASLQSDAATKILLQLNKKSFENFDSIVLVENEQLYFKSTAALKIAKNLNGFIQILYIFIIIPTPIRDYIYDFIARNRYKWFGKKDKCMIPDKEFSERFL
ncbi:MAG: thiol-disulfide oxidoreductase DCC family protein [Flavobacteriaceae bacterium]